jgi:hypothetical protein
VVSVSETNKFAPRSHPMTIITHRHRPKRKRPKPPPEIPTPIVHAPKPGKRRAVDLPDDPEADARVAAFFARMIRAGETGE